RLVVSGIGDLPFGLMLSTVSIFAAPRPYQATDGRDLNTDNNFGDDFVGGIAHRVIRPVAAWNNMYRTVDLRLAKVVPVGGARPRRAWRRPAVRAGRCARATTHGDGSSQRARHIACDLWPRPFPYAPPCACNTSSDRAWPPAQPSRATRTQDRACLSSRPLGPT